jgi:hypothetical protein
VGTRGAIFASIDGAVGIPTTYAYTDLYSVTFDKTATTIEFYAGTDYSKVTTDTIILSADVNCYSADAEEFVTGIEAYDDNTRTVYFDNTQGWADIYAYVWTTDGYGDHELTAWPGVPAAFVGDDVWSYTFSNYYENIVFNDGVSKQTEDIALLDYTNLYHCSSETDGAGHYYVITGNRGITVYFHDVYDWANTRGDGEIYAYVDDTEAAWPGTAMTFVDIDGEGYAVYKYTMPTDEYDVVFSAYYDTDDPTNVKTAVFGLSCDIEHVYPTGGNDFVAGAVADSTPYRVIQIYDNYDASATLGALMVNGVGAAAFDNRR